MTRHIRPNLIVKLPKGSKSPTNSIYKRYDIVEQSRAVSQYEGVPDVVYCDKPFTLRVEVKGKIKDLHSKAR